jgi:hypothetical protein
MTPQTAADEAENLPNVPEGWSVFRDATHDRFYYVNHLSGQTVWTLPASAFSQEPATPATGSTNTITAAKSRLPVGWTAYIDAKTSRWYYVGPAGETTWYRPGSTDDPRADAHVPHPQPQQPSRQTIDERRSSTTNAVPKVGASSTTAMPPGPPPAPSASASPSWGLASVSQSRTGTYDSTRLSSGVPRRRRSSDVQSKSLSERIRLANQGQRLFHLGYDRQSDEPFALHKLCAS